MTRSILHVGHRAGKIIATNKAERRNLRRLDRLRHKAGMDGPAFVLSDHELAAHKSVPVMDTILAQYQQAIEARLQALVDAIPVAEFVVRYPDD